MSPSTNLLPPKSADEDGDVDEPGLADVRKMNRDIDRSVRDSQRKAMQDVQKEMGKIKVEIPKIKEDTISPLKNQLTRRR